jgi:cytochrome c biogenesis protein CcmG/thiol:disulfide interchange protein DsbE
MGCLRCLFVRQIAWFAGLLVAGGLAYGADLDLGQYRGKVVYLDFWASWCGPCRQSFPWLADIERHYGSDKLVVVGVNVDHDPHLAEHFLNETPANFPIIYDPAGALATAYHVTAMPSSILIDRTGHIRYRHNGFTVKEEDEYERQISELLGEK